MATKNILKEDQSASTAGNTSSMRTHFNIFYKKYVQSNPQARKDLTLDNITQDEVSDDLLGSFANYLTTAKWQTGGKDKKDVQLLSYGSAMINFSSLKTNLKLRFSSSKVPINVLTDEHCRLYTTRIRKTKISQSNANDTALQGEYKTASIADRRGMVALAFWGGRHADIEFVLLFSSLIVNCGRGSEVCLDVKKYFAFEIFLHTKHSYLKTFFPKTFRLPY